MEINLSQQNTTLNIALGQYPPNCERIVISLPNGERVIHDVTPNQAIPTDVVERYMRHLTRTNALHPNTLHDHRRCIAELVGAINLSDPTAWQDYYVNSRERLAVATVRRRFYKWRLFADWLVAGRYLPANPLSDVALPQFVKKNYLPLLTERTLG